MKRSFEFVSQSSSRIYTTVVAADGRLNCNCPGWTFKRGDNPRACTHTAQVAARLRARVTTRGQFTYAPSLAAVKQ